MNKTVLTSFTILCLLSTLVLMGLQIPVKAGPDLRVHNIDTGLDYATIQEAIDANETSDGHTIYVDEGTYYEHVVVDKSLTLIGENKSTTIIDGDNYGNVFNLFQVENVSISGLTIQNSGPTLSDNGILISYSTNITVHDNIITENNWNGVLLISSINSNISHNSITNNRHRGIDLTTSSHNIVSGNNLTDNIDGCTLFLSHNNTLSDNIASNNTDLGIAVSRSSGNTLRNNIMTNNPSNFVISYELKYWGNDVDASNLVDGRPICYWVGKQDDEVPLNAGWVALINCSNITVNNLTLENNREGILLVNTNNSLITRNSITKSTTGIILWLSHNNTIASNTIYQTGIMRIGLILYDNSNNNTITANNITNDWAGIVLDNSRDNIFFHNNLVGSATHASVQYSAVSSNVWDNGLEGNYWSDYTGVDSDYDGIGDTSYVIEVNNQDNYPLMGMFQGFNTSLGYTVNVISNSTIEDFEYFESNNTIKMHVSNMTVNQTFGFCRIRIPHALMNETYHVIVDGEEPYYVNCSLYDDGNNRWIYFIYEHSTLEVVIVPEFTSSIVLPLFMMVTLLAIAVSKKKHFK